MSRMVSSSYHRTHDEPSSYKRELYDSKVVQWWLHENQIHNSNTVKYNHNKHHCYKHHSNNILSLHNTSRRHHHSHTNDIHHIGSHIDLLHAIAISNSSSIDLTYMYHTSTCDYHYTNGKQCNGGYIEQQHHHHHPQ